MGSLSKEQARDRRRKRIRKKVYGTMEKPRLSVFRSNKHIYAQVIDDVSGNTLAQASTVDPEVGKKLEQTGNINASAEVGTLIGERAKSAKIEAVVFDRGGNLYHGRVKSLADAARKTGLKF